MTNSVSLSGLDPRAVVDSTRGDIDAFDWIDGMRDLLPHIGRPRAPKGAPLLVGGWAVDPTKNARPAAVAVAIDTQPPVAATAELDRTDVRTLLGPETARDIGFRAVVPTGDLPPGLHAVRAYALGVDGTWYAAADFPFWLFRSVDLTMTPRSGKIRLEVDNVTDVAPDNSRGPVTRVVYLGNFAVISGWAVDVDSRVSPVGVCAMDGRGNVWSSPCDLQRPDVRGALGARSDELGFELVIPTGALGRGRHELDVWPFDGTGRRYGHPTSVAFDVGAERRVFPCFARASGEHVDTAVQCSLDGTPRLLRASSILDCRRGDDLPLQGWCALDGRSAAQVFLELDPTAVRIPPLRYQTYSGFERAKQPRNLPSPPVADAWFEYTIDTSDLAPGAYSLRLAYVKDGRHRYAYAELGALRLAAGRTLPGTDQRF